MLFWWIFFRAVITMLVIHLFVWFVLECMNSMKILCFFCNLFLFLIYACLMNFFYLVLFVLCSLVYVKLFIAIQSENRRLLIIILFVVLRKYWFCQDLSRDFIYWARCWMLRLTCKVIFMRFKCICFRRKHFMASLQIIFTWCAQN